MIGEHSRSYRLVVSLAQQVRQAVAEEDVIAKDQPRWLAGYKFRAKKIGLRKPVGRNAPDYASKIHIVTAPCYYHNYMMGELFACQIHEAMAKALESGPSPKDAVLMDDPRVGKWMTERVFAPGRTLPWNDLTKHATGKPLNAAPFAADFAD